MNVAFGRSIIVVFWLVVLAPRAALAFPGDLDPTFGVDGVVSVPALAAGRAMALQADRSIIVIHDGNRLSRFGPDGTLDATFGAAGVVETPFSAYVVAAQSDGTILVAGGSGGEFALARYDANGVLDPSFGSGGVATLALGTSGYATAAVVQSSGATVIAGTAAATGPRKIVLARLTATGMLDGTFGAAGTATAPVDTPSDLVTLRLAAGDALIVVGSSAGATVMRYSADGEIDATFAVGGIFWRGDLAATDAALQPDGAIVFTGFDADLGIATGRLTVAGVLDSTFGGDGIVGHASFSFGASVVIEPNGNVVVAGQILHDAMSGTESNFVLFRWAPNGDADPHFGVAGVADTDLGGAEAIVASARDGETLVVVGSQGAEAAFGDDAQAVLARYELGALCRVRPACKGAVTGKSALELRDDASDADKKRFRWTYRKGEATTLAEIGDPRTRERYVLCAFDVSGAEPVTTAAVPLPPGPACSASTCWRAIGSKGFRYRAKPEAAAGIDGVTITSGGAGKTSITVNGHGAQLQPAELPRALPLRLQLQAAGGACWESVFSSAGVHRNDTSRFKATSD